jgi:hypothetical protein
MIGLLAAVALLTAAVATASSAPPTCSIGGLSASFTRKPLGGYGAYFRFALTIRNRGRSGCELATSPEVVFLDPVSGGCRRSYTMPVRPARRLSCCRGSGLRPTP